MRPTITRHTRATAAALLLVTTGVATGLTGAVTDAGATPSPSPAPVGPPAELRREARGFYDVRAGTGRSGRAAALRVVARASARPQTEALQRSLGDTALVDLDGVTGTPRLVAKLDGYLTGPSTRSPQRIAKDYLAANLAAFGLEASDLSSLVFRNDYVDIAGTHHLSWTQVFDGTPVFGSGLLASVTRRGRLLTIGGSPVPGALITPRPAPRLTATQALRAARRDAGETRLRPGPRDATTKVLLVTRRATYAGWRSLTMSADQPAVTVHDATSGRLLYRRPLGQHERGERRATRSTGVAFTYFPGARRGGDYVSVDYTAKGWLSGRAKKLAGNNAHAYSDVDDNNRATAAEEVGPSRGHTWGYRLKPFRLPRISFCGNPYPCSWNPNKPFSWKTNRAQNTAQVFFFVNNFHDHLLKAPIGFTEDAGNFERRNSSGQGFGRDAVDAQTMDGANTAAGLPDGSHIDNANMYTPPDGFAPTMQMYLQHQPGTSYPDEDPFPANNTGDQGDTVYHEYTHGLSNRLVLDPTGFSSLGPVQAGAMGEGWSDWYAFDYLVGARLHLDRAARADVYTGEYDGAGQALVRTEPMDCRLGSPSTQCPGGETGHAGGYTYADYGRVVGVPEVHGDGEIWAQTLWALRTRLGSATTASLVTRAMELAPYNPSFLDMRNALLMADTAVHAGAHRTAIWSVFAERGMGFFAGSLGGDDAAPAPDFHPPPTTITKAVLTGTVVDSGTGAPVAGVPVTLAFQGGNAMVNPTAVTAADGTYSLGPVPVGDYGKVVVSGAGYDTLSQPVTVLPGGSVADFTVRRDWAAASGGGSVHHFTGPDYTLFGCGPGGAIDGSLATGWGSTTGDDDGTPTSVAVPKSIVLRLPQPVDVSAVAIDPSATCGDGASASLGQFRLRLSPDGTSWTTAAQGAFGPDDRGRLNELTPSAGADAVEYVEVTMLGNQTPDFATTCPGGAYDGCSFTDLSEIAVYGAPTPP